jgi:hypothetical protein
VGDAIQKEFGESMTLVFNKTVEGGCSKRRPDIHMDFGSHCVMIEIDENRHLNYSCEEKRMVDLYEDVGFRKCVFLRFNPDGYCEAGTRYTTPFSFTAACVMVVEETEMKRRMEELIQRVHYFNEQTREDQPQNSFSRFFEPTNRTSQWNSRQVPEQKNFSSHYSTPKEIHHFYPSEEETSELRTSNHPFSRLNSNREFQKNRNPYLTEYNFASMGLQDKPTRAQKKYFETI